jgi:hypothetical protein
MFRLLIAGLLLLQDADLDRLVQQLGDGDPLRRDEAVRKIRQIGPGAKEALEKSMKSADPEIRARITGILEVFERERQEALLETAERKKVFPRVTVNLADVPLGDVLAELSRQSGWAWAPGNINLDQKVTLTGKDLTMTEALDRIGLEWWFQASGEAVIKPRSSAPEGVIVFDDGVRLAFRRRLWSPKGTAVGTIFETKMTSAFDGDVRWSVASVKTDRDLSVETCAIHSPGLVYVALPDLINPRVTVKGTRLWLCPIPIEFRELRNGASRQIGSSQILLEWPSFRVITHDPMNEELLRKMLRSEDIRTKIKPGREKDAIGVGIGGGRGGRFGGRFTQKNPTWCGCDGQPETKPLNPPASAKEFTVEIPRGTLYSIEDIESISVTFRKPVEESFEVSSPPLP